MRFYRRLEGLAMQRVLGARGRSVRAMVLFGKVVIMWDAPDHGRKVDFR